VITVAQVGFGGRLRAAQAFGDVLPRHLEMHATGTGPFRLVDGERLAHFRQDISEHPLSMAVPASARASCSNAM
jgi:hypothetical protein